MSALDAATIEKLLGELERLPAVSPQTPLDEVARYALERAPLCAALATIGAAPLSESARATLAARLGRILSRDQALVSALFARHEDVGAQLRALARATRAARGYGAGPRTERLLRKTA